LSNHRLILEYDGAGFNGWQAQPEASGARTVAGELARALVTVTGERPRLNAAGRTDAGAHSLGQTVSFSLAREVAPDELRRSLNGVLPGDVAVVSSDLVGDRFHARFSARTRHYRYLVENREARPALLRQRAWHVRQPLDVPAMRAAAQRLLGRRDLGAFGRDPGGRSTVRSLQRLRIRRLGGVAGAVLAFELSADAFLYGMVRRIVGFLVEVGLHRRSPGDVETVLRSGPVPGIRVAPAHGLYQLRAEY